MSVPSSSSAKLPLESDGGPSSERLFSDTMVESMPGIVYFYDMEGQFLRWNRNFELVSGYSGEEIARMHPLDFFGPQEKHLLQQRIADVFEKGEATVEANFRAKDGRQTLYFFTGRRVFFEGKRCLVGVGIDVSERHQAETRLIESERKYREFVEHANSIILRWNSDGIITLLNEYGQRFFGYTSDEIIGRHVLETIVPPQESSGRDLQRLIEEICASPENFEQNVNENIRRDGERVWVAWTNRIVRDPHGKVVEFLSIGTDITARKRAEEARQEIEARYRKLFECAPDGILIADSNGCCLDANHCLCTMLRCTPDDLVGKPLSQVCTVELNPQSEEDASADRIDSEPRERIIRRKDGTTFDAEVIAATMPDGNLLSVFRDISERKQAEAERERLHRAEAADRIKSAFLATMSHELRTPLNSIIGFTGILLQGLAGPLNAEQRKQLDMVRTSACHLLALVNDILDISKIEAGQLEVAHEPFAVRASLDKVLGIVTPLAKSKKLHLRSVVAAELGTAIGDERRFEQVLLNILSNAVKFTDSGEVALEAARIDYSFSNGDAPEPAIWLRVSDTGMGIKREDLSSLFQPFRQIDSGLARRHEGTGLGLAICQRLVMLMGGALKVESEWQVGTNFTVILPTKER